MPHNFALNNQFLRVKNRWNATGTTGFNSEVVDMAGANEVTFIAAFGTSYNSLTATLTAQTGDESDLSDAADLTGSIVSVTEGATGTAVLSNNCLVVNVPNPGHRYVRATVDLSGATGTVDGVFAVLSGFRNCPVDQDSTVYSAYQCVGAETDGATGIAI